MKHKLLAGAAAVALMASAGANAAFDPDGSIDFGGSGAGDVVLSVVELTGDGANSPYVNISFGSVADYLAATVDGIVVDNNVELDNLLSNATNAIAWNVVGIYNNIDLSGFGLLTTATAAPTATDYTVMSSAVNNNRTWMTANQGVAVGDTVTGTNATGDVQGALNGNKIGLVGQAGNHTVSAALGDSLNFFQHFATDNFLANGGVADVDALREFTLTYNALDGAQLTYAAAAPVPLPAAAWLFASAVLGMVGVARRRAA